VQLNKPSMQTENRLLEKLTPSITRQRMMQEAQQDSRVVQPGGSAPAGALEEVGGLAGVHGQSYVYHKGNVEITRWNGRFGNNVLQMAAALSYAKSLGAKALILPSFPAASKLFELPQKIELSEASDGTLLPKCDAVNATGVFWQYACDRVPAKVAHNLVTKYIRPHLSKELRTCIAAPYRASEEQLLTVHFRTGDILDITAPCSFVERIFKDGSFDRILLVSAGEHPCEAALVDRLGKEKVKATRLRNEAKRLMLDICALIRAKHLLFAHSTFPEGAMMLGNSARTVYKASDFEAWIPYGHKLFDWCVDDQNFIWDQVQLERYHFNAYSGKVANHLVKPSRLQVQLMLNHSEENVVPWTQANRCNRLAVRPE